MSTNFNLKFLSKIMELEDDNGVNVVKNCRLPKLLPVLPSPFPPKKWSP